LKANNHNVQRKKHQPFESQTDVTLNYNQ